MIRSILITTCTALVLQNAEAQQGFVTCWGLNNEGQCDPPTGTFTQVAACNYHSLGIQEDGTIKCWGWNRDGQCDAPAGVFTEIAAGWYHSLGVREDSTLACWGWNNEGQCNAP